MRVHLAIALLAIIAISSVSAHEGHEHTPEQDCIEKIQTENKPCEAADNTCTTAKTTAESCVNAEHCTETVECVKKCKGTNEKVAAHVDKMIACFSASTSSTILTFASIVGLFVMLF